MTQRPDKKCDICGDPCLCDQTDRAGRPAHFGCQHVLPIAARHPRLTEHPSRHFVVKTTEGRNTP